MGYFPTNMLIAKFGLRKGLMACLGGAVVGAALCCLVNVSIYLYILGYFVMVFSLQGIHAGKGYFVNRYYNEKAVCFDALTAARKGLHLHHDDDASHGLGLLCCAQ